MNVPKVVLLTIACGVVLGGLVVRSARTSVNSVQNQELPPLEKRLEWFASRAKAKGQTKVSLPAPHTEYLGSSASTTLDKALSVYTAVIAIPTFEKSYVVNSEDIETWVRFNIVDVVSKADSPACPGCDVPQPPEEFSKVNDNEFVMARTGGAVTIDGVNVEMKDPQFPDFQVGKKYLLFISRYPSGAALIGIGPGGILSVGDEGKLKGFSERLHPVRTEIEEGLNGSLPNVKGRARSLGLSQR